MKKLYTLFITFSALCFSICSLSAQTPAFPGAEGFGKNATGGRGGRVIEVTNLDDYAENGTPVEGSFRQALKTSGDDPITIVFRVSGVIDLKERLKCGRSNMTIAGQTAPGDGVCISGNNIYFSGKNFIIRHMRFRTGDVQQANASCVNIENAENFIIDHCSFSWSMEENMTVYDNKNSTVQWCILSEPLYKSVHPKGSRGYGSQWGGQYASYHHNLIAHAYSRAPRVNGSRAHDVMAINDFVNNVIYNWGKKNAVYGGESQLADGVSHINWVNNYYKPGPASPNNSYIAEASFKTNEFYSKWYVNGNYFDSNNYATVNNDNQRGMNYVGGADNQRSDNRFEVEDVTTTTAAQAYIDVLAGAGARLPKLDPLDRRIIAEAKGEIAPAFGGVLGATKGIIDTQTDVGGWPEYVTGNVPVDTDKDGIPDEWETANGLNPNDAADGALITESGYSNLEIYMNSIVADIETGICTPVEVKKTCKVFYDQTGQMIHINSENKISEINLYNINGNKTLQQNIDAYNAYLSTTEQPKGVYIINIRLVSGVSEHYKVIVNE